MSDALVTFDHNSDGSVIAKLAKPLKFKGQDVDRMTIPAIRGKHLRHASFMGGDVPIGALIEFAAKIVEPVGVVDELSVPEAMAVATEVATALSKSTRGS